MGRELFLDFFTEHEVPVIRKRRHTFLKMDDENVYVLKEGVVKVSVLMRDGREFNIAYLKGFDILSMFKDAVVDCKFSSLMIRVESDEASFYCVSKELFNQLLNEHTELVEYVNTYYRKKLSETISRQELMTMNGKNGAVCAFIYYLVTMFGKEARDGISTRHSVNRILRGLREEHVIRTLYNKIMVLDVEYLKQFVDVKVDA